MTQHSSRIRVAEHASEEGSWRLAFLAPTRRMAPFVRQFNAYAEHDTRFARRRELPTGAATLIFNLGRELRIEQPSGARTSFGSGDGLYSGPVPRYVVSETDGAQEGVQVMLTLLGARYLAGRPLGEIGERLAEPADVLGAAGDEITERLLETRSYAQRLAILEQAMARRLADGGSVPRDLVWVWRRLQSTAGYVRVGELAAALGCSRKHLTVRFHHEFGMAPKQFARILRFDKAMRLIRQERPPSWVELALHCGYSDQAHLAREFREFAGSPPAAFLRRRLPDEGGFID